MAAHPALRLAFALTASLTPSACRAQAPPTPPFPDLARPIIFAHRGGAGEAPESTLGAMQAALAANPGVAIELDVHQSRDGHIVVIHDDTVDRTTNGTGPVAQRTLAELQALDAGYCATPGQRRGTAPRGACRAATGSFPFRGKGYRIPTLDEVLATLPRETLIGIEVKAAGFEPTLAERLRASGRLRRLVVGSARDDIAQRLRKLLPQVPHYFPRWAGMRFATAIKLSDGRLSSPDYQVFATPRAASGMQLDTAGLIRAASKLGVLVAYWTINDADDMERLLRLGAHAIMTDYPDRASKVAQRLARDR